MKKKTKNKLLIFLVICAFIINYVFDDSTNTEDSLTSSNISSENLKIHFLDVGQADSIFIELPNSETMLIDAGNNADDDFVVEYIENLNYNKINYVVGTHPHEDHIGGLDTVIETFDVDNIYMPKVENNTKTFEDVLLAIQEKNLKIKTAKQGVNILTDDNFSIDILSPVNSEYKELNDYSAVIKINFLNNSFLFMGDAEKVAEEGIIDDVRADLIKIGHHGSITSTSNEFLTKVSPKYAIISVGKDNSYNHPSEVVIDLLNKKGIHVYRTDERGNIIVTSDGSNISINTSK